MHFQNSTRRHARAAGFTLVEVMVAASVLALTIAGSVIAIQIGFLEFELSRATAVATQVMQSESERLRLQDWSAICALPAETEVDLGTAITSEALPVGALRLIRSVDDVPGFANMKEIHLRAEWTSISGRAHSRSLMLRYSKRGLYDYYYGS